MPNLINSYDTLNLIDLVTNISGIVHTLDMPDNEREELQQLFSEIEVRIESQDSDLQEVIESIEKIKES